MSSRFEWNGSNWNFKWQRTLWGGESKAIGNKIDLNLFSTQLRYPCFDKKTSNVISTKKFCWACRSSTFDLFSSLKQRTRTSSWSGKRFYLQRCEWDWIMLLERNESGFPMPTITYTHFHLQYPIIVFWFWLPRRKLHVAASTLLVFDFLFILFRKAIGEQYDFHILLVISFAMIFVVDESTSCKLHAFHLSADSIWEMMNDAAYFLAQIIRKCCIAFFFTGYSFLTVISDCLIWKGGNM